MVLCKKYPAMVTIFMIMVTLLSILPRLLAATPGATAIALAGRRLDQSTARCDY
jgi:hypothetical protein